MMPLTVKNLTKTFYSGVWPFQQQSSYTAVDSISFSVNKGEILGLLGSNGAGKTTTIQMLLGTLTPTSGSINYFGSSFATDRIATLNQIGYASGYDKLPARLTVFENLDIVGRIHGIPEPQRTKKIEQLLARFNLLSKRNKLAGSLSAGQATRTILAKAFLNNPKLVLLDEPTASLDPRSAQEVRSFIIQEQKERALSMIITSHNMHEVTELCNRVLVMQHGSIVANNTPQELAQSIFQARVQLLVTDGLPNAVLFLQEQNLLHTIENNSLTIELHEHEVALLLTELGKRSVTYAQISIDKPTLEDYFLSLTDHKD